MNKTTYSPRNSQVSASEALAHESVWMNEKPKGQYLEFTETKMTHGLTQTFHRKIKLGR